MHRIASLPGNDPQEEITFIEQPNAPVIFLTSATSDITCLSSVLKLSKNKKWRNKIRALPVAYLSSNASIDHLAGLCMLRFAYLPYLSEF